MIGSNRPSPFGADAAQRVQDAVRAVDAVEEAVDLRAQLALAVRVVGPAPQLDGDAVLDGDRPSRTSPGSRGGTCRGHVCVVRPRLGGQRHGPTLRDGVGRLRSGAVTTTAVQLGRQPALAGRRAGGAALDRRGRGDRAAGRRRPAAGQGDRRRALVHRRRRRPTACSSRSTGMDRVLDVDPRPRPRPRRRPGIRLQRAERRSSPPSGWPCPTSATSTASRSPAPSPPPPTAPGSASATWPRPSSGWSSSPAPATSCASTSRRDPELLRVARVGLGALGIVTEVTLQCVPAFELHARETIEVARRRPRRVRRAGRRRRPLRAVLDARRRHAAARSSATGAPTSRPARSPRLAYARDKWIGENLGFGLVCRVGRRFPTRGAAHRQARHVGAPASATSSTAATGSSAARARCTSSRWSTASRSSTSPDAVRRLRDFARRAADAGAVPDRGAGVGRRRHPAVDRLRPDVGVDRRAPVPGHAVRGVLRRRRADHGRLRRPPALGQAARPAGRHAGRRATRSGPTSGAARDRLDPDRTFANPTSIACSADAARAPAGRRCSTRRPTASFPPADGGVERAAARPVGLVGRRRPDRPRLRARRRRSAPSCDAAAPTASAGRPSRTCCGWLAGPDGDDRQPRRRARRHGRAGGTGAGPPLRRRTTSTTTRGCGGPAHHRRDVEVHGDDDGLVVVGRGLVGRWELAVELPRPPAQGGRPRPAADPRRAGRSSRRGSGAGPRSPRATPRRCGRSWPAGSCRSARRSSSTRRRGQLAFAGVHVVCPRCGRDGDERFYGPCSSCRDRAAGGVRPGRPGRRRRRVRAEDERHPERRRHQGLTVPPTAIGADPGTCPRDGRGVATVHDRRAGPRPPSQLPPSCGAGLRTPATADATPADARPGSAAASLSVPRGRGATGSAPPLQGGG